MDKIWSLTLLNEWPDENLVALMKLIVRKLKENGVYDYDFKHQFHGINYMKDFLVDKCKDKYIPTYSLSFFWDTFDKAFKNEALSSILTIDILNDPGFVNLFYNGTEVEHFVEDFTKKEILFALGSSDDNFRKLSLNSGEVLKRFMDKYDKDMHYINKSKLRYIPGFIEKYKKI